MTIKKQKPTDPKNERQALVERPTPVIPKFLVHEGSLDDELNQLLDPIPAAQVLHVQPQTLAKWRCQKTYDLPYVRVGRLVRYRKRDLLAFLQANVVSGVRA